MRRVFLIVTALTLSFSMTSCWEFNRTQRLKNAENNGKSILVEAENSKKAMIETAKAEARIKIAKAEAQAEIERAKGVAEANKIIGESMKGNSEYLEYLKIQSLEKSNTIYVPTEANIPITERRR